MRRHVLAAGFCMLTAPALAGGFTVTTPAFGPYGTIPMAQVFSGFGCTGGDHSPALSWSGAPVGTESYAVTMYDPDAPSGSGWWHWTVFNIPASVHCLVADAGAANSHDLPPGVAEGRNDFGFSRYGGPCLPSGDKPHRYVITVFALQTPHVALDANSSGALMGSMLHANTLATAQIVGRYGRPR
jgi:Raf kinase inhibitor-like YbhB/YbcL family protein